MSNSSLVEYTRISPNSNNPRSSGIKKITIHHCAGNVAVETLGSIFAAASRQASANYGIGSDGRVGMYVEEKNRAWTSSNAENDQQAVTIEVANDGGAPDWHVSDKALSKLIELCVDICQRNGIEKRIIREIKWEPDDAQVVCSDHLPGTVFGEQISVYSAGGKPAAGGRDSPRGKRSVVLSAVGDQCGQRDRYAGTVYERKYRNEQVRI